MSGKGNIFLSFLVLKADFNCILMSGKINIYFTKYILYQSLLYTSFSCGNNKQLLHSHFVQPFLDKSQLQSFCTCIVKCWSLHWLQKLKIKSWSNITILPPSSLPATMDSCFHLEILTKNLHKHHDYNWLKQNTSPTWPCRHPSRGFQLPQFAGTRPREPPVGHVLPAVTMRLYKVS